MERQDQIDDGTRALSSKDDDINVSDAAPDPDEDDLDDLDGILDEFSASQPLTSAQEPVVVAQSVSEASGNDADVFPSDVFSKDLQEQMTALMGGMEGLSANNDQPRTSTSHQQPPRTERDFQESIRKTMERMQASDSQAASGTEDESVDDLLAQVLKEIGNGDPAGGEDEDGLNKMLLGMMEQLTNKEVLYDPMKEMQEKFPAWMEKNRLTSRPADMERYEDQQRIVGDILARFDRKQYSDANTEDRDFIVERMQQMQAAGSPPADLVGGLEAAEALGDVESTCAQQ